MSMESFQRWVGSHRDRVYNFAYYTLRHAEDAEDVTQEVLIRLWNHRAKLEEPTVLAWLLKVTKNACFDTLRKHRSRRARFEEGRDDFVRDTVASGDPDPQKDAETDELQTHLITALRGLPDSYRAIVVLREVEGLKYDEIAEVTGKSVASVKVSLHRGRKMLREALAVAHPATVAPATAEPTAAPGGRSQSTATTRCQSSAPRALRQAEDLSLNPIQKVAHA